MLIKTLFAVVLTLTLSVPALAQKKASLSELKQSLSIIELKLKIKRSEYQILSERHDGLTKQLADMDEKYRRMQRQGKVIEKQIAQAAAKPTQETTYEPEDP